MRRAKSNEHGEQSAYFDWWRAYAKSRHIHESLCFAIKNDSAHTDAGRIYRWKEGVQAGVWDVFLAIPRGGYHGMFLEFKYGKNKLDPKQLEFYSRVSYYNYRMQAVWSADEAIKEVQQYLRLPFKY